MNHDEKINEYLEIVSKRQRIDADNSTMLLVLSTLSDEIKRLRNIIKEMEGKKC